MKNKAWNGKLFEPKSTAEFLTIYKFAEEIFDRKFAAFWLGITDVEKEGDFKLSSNRKSLMGAWEVKLPWAKNQPNGGKKENCLVTLKGRWYDYECCKVSWSICESIPQSFPQSSPRFLAPLS